MASIVRPWYTKIDAATGKRVKRRSRKWHAQLAGGKRVPLHTTSKAAAQTMLADLLRGEAPAPSARAENVTDVIAAWERSLAARQLDVRQARLLLYRVRAAVTACEWRTISQVSDDDAAAYLASLMPALAPKTRNDYADALAAWGKWLVKTGRVRVSPFAGLGHVSVETDRRHDRRALAPAEIKLLLTATLSSTRTFRGLTGEDRHALYLVALATGFRAAELAAICPAWFLLDHTPPVVRLAGRDTKNKRAVTQPLPADLVPLLRAYLASRPDGVSVWPGSWYTDASEMIAADLQAAGVAYVVDSPDGPLYADFHALRHSAIAMLDRPGVTIKQTMTLARHSDPKLTMKIYGRARLADLGAAVDAAFAGLAPQLALPAADVDSHAPTAADKSLTTTPTARVVGSRAG